MAVQIFGTTARVGASGVDDFIKIRLEGQAELVRALLRAATQAGQDATPALNAACREAMRPIMQRYKDSVPDVTGNLRKSVQIRNLKGTKIAGAGAAIGGPAHASAGSEWDVNVKGAGNHAWLVEFGTGRRRPSTQGRRTYLNVHQEINGKFQRVGGSNKWFNNEQFERMGKGFYFIMGSRDEPTRQARKGSGYPHDFGPFAIGPGETYAAMPARHAMERAIQATQGEAKKTLIDAIKQQINKIQAA